MIRPPPPRPMVAPTPRVEQQRPEKVYMDAQGRLIDENGSIITLQKRHDLKVNEKSSKDNKTKDLERMMKFGKQTQQNSTNQIRKKFFDQALENPSHSRRDRKRLAGIQFVEQGTYVKRGDIMRRKQAQEQLELDPLTNFQHQLCQDQQNQAQELNMWGEPTLKFKPAAEEP